MTFHIEFAAFTVEAARRNIAETVLPRGVKEFLSSALDAYESGPNKRQDLIPVCASGHLADAGASYDSSTLAIEVRCIRFIDETDGGEAEPFSH